MSKILYFVRHGQELAGAFGSAEKAREWGDREYGRKKYRVLNTYRPGKNRRSRGGRR